MDRDFMSVAKSWLTGNFDAETKEQVKALFDDPVALEDAFYRNLEFGTGGLRGIMGVGTNRMNRYTVGMATQGLANYIIRDMGSDGKCLCISYDCRNNSAEFARIAADVLCANGFDVYMFDSLRPTPELSYAIRLNKAVAGIMITASHNPKEYNGYKVFWSDGAQITSPVDKEIVQEVSSITDPSQVKFIPQGHGCGTLHMMGEDVDSQYLKDILSLSLSPESVARHNDIKIVYTPLHGTGVRLVPRALDILGFKNVFHVPEQDVNDGNFPTVKSPNPEEPSALKMAVDIADAERADIVMATDPDADRVGIAVRDFGGRMVLLNGNQTASILTHYILSRWKELGRLDGKQYIVKTIVTSDILTTIAERFGVETYNVLTGFKYIAEIVRENEGRKVFVCGGEESYGFNIGEFVRDKDAVIACSMIAEAAAWAADRGKTLYGLLMDIYSQYGCFREKLLSVTKKGKSGLEQIADMMASFRQNPPATLGGVPVVKVIDYNDPDKTGLPKSNVLQFITEDSSMISVRPSGTEPKIKFYVSVRDSSASAADPEKTLVSLESKADALLEQMRRLSE